MYYVLAVVAGLLVGAVVMFFVMRNNTKFFKEAEARVKDELIKTRESMKKAYASLEQEYYDYKDQIVFKYNKIFEETKEKHENFVKNMEEKYKNIVKETEEKTKEIENRYEKIKKDVVVKVQEVYDEMESNIEVAKKKLEELLDSLK